METLTSRIDNMEDRILGIEGKVKELNHAVKVKDGFRKMHD